MSRLVPFPIPEGPAQVGVHRLTGVGAVGDGVEVCCHLRGDQRNRLPTVEFLVQLHAAFLVPGPVGGLEFRDVEWARVSAQGLGLVDGAIMFEVGHHQLAEIPVDRLAEAEVDVVRLGDSAPATVELVQREDMVVVLTGVSPNVKDQRTEADPPQGQGGKQSAIQTVTLEIAHHVERRAVPLLGAIGHRVQILLDEKGGGQCVESGKQVRGEMRFEFGQNGHGASGLIKT